MNCISFLFLVLDGHFGNSRSSNCNGTSDCARRTPVSEHQISRIQEERSKTCHRVVCKEIERNSRNR